VVENRNSKEKCMLSPTLYALIVVALAVLASPAQSGAAEAACPTVHDQKFSNLKDESVSLCQFKGNV
jgi:hypothetical protein